MWWPRVSAPWPSGVAGRCQPLTKSLKASDAVFTATRSRLSRNVVEWAGRNLQPARLYSTIDALQLPLGNRNRAGGRLAAGAVVGEHVDHQEVGDRGRRLLARCADARRGKRAFAGLAEHCVLRVGGPHW